jgi:hypothetical protein
MSKIICVALSVLSNIGLATEVRKYTCADLARLQSLVGNGESVARGALQMMGKTQNLCVKTVEESNGVVSVKYLDHGRIRSDRFKFSKDNMLLSLERTFATDGKVAKGAE